MASHPVGIRPVELPFGIAPAAFPFCLGDGVEPILHKVHDKARIIAIATFSEKIGGEGAACGAIGFLAYNAKMLAGIGNLLLGEHGADLVGVVAGALENLKLAVLIVCQRESLRRAHADLDRKSKRRVGQECVSTSRSRWSRYH